MQRRRPSRPTAPSPGVGAYSSIAWSAQASEPSYTSASIATVNVLPTRRRSSAEIRSNWRLRRSACRRVAGRELEAAIPVLPVATGAVHGGAHAGVVLGFRAAAVGGKRLGDLGENELPDAVARMRERERDVGVEALELGRVARAADPGVERRPVIGSRAAAGKLVPDALLQRRRGGEVGGQLGARRDGGAPALDASGRLEPGDARHEVTARQVVGRRERALPRRRTGSARSPRGRRRGSALRPDGTRGGAARSGARRRRDPPRGELYGVVA